MTPPWSYAKNAFIAGTCHKTLLPATEFRAVPRSWPDLDRLVIGWRKQQRYRRGVQSARQNGQLGNRDVLSSTILKVSDHRSAEPGIRARLSDPTAIEQTPCHVVADGPPARLDGPGLLPSPRAPSFVA